MLPVVAEVIEIFESIAGRELKVAKANRTLLNDIVFVFRIWNTVCAPTYGELMQVIILPAHDGLNDAVKPRQCEINRHLDPPPYRWLDAFEN